MIRRSYFSKRKLNTSYKLFRLGAKALSSTKHPILVHLVPMRRCNLACGYCNEYDKVSPPVPTNEMIRRIDKLAELGTTMISFSGGEPLLHPDLDQLITHAASHGIFTELLTNGYLLTEKRIQQLNDAGLDRLQISIDNIKPDDISMKSLKVLDQKLKRLHDHAEFDVNINTVMIPGMENPNDAMTVAARASEFGFSGTVGIVHDEHGQLKPMGEEEREVYQKLKRFNSPALAVMGKFKDNLASGKPNNWRCRAGARYLYICENGLVHYCSQQRGTPGTPLSEYAQADLDREFNQEKSCAPMCTINCVHAVAAFDNWRKPQRSAQRALQPSTSST